MKNTNIKNRLKVHFLSGFTMLETIIVIVIGAILLSVAFYSFSSLQNNSSIQKNVSQVKSLLEEARFSSVSEKSDYAYGLHLQSDRITSFRGLTYNATDTENTIQLLDGATIDNISLNGGGSDVIFNKITGSSDTFGTFRIKLIEDVNQNTTIRISRTGIISEE